MFGIKNMLNDQMIKKGLSIFKDWMKKENFNEVKIFFDKDGELQFETVKEPYHFISTELAKKQIDNLRNTIKLLQENENIAKRV